MDKQEYQERINKALEKEQKILKRIDKWSVGLSQEAIDEAKLFGERTENNNKEAYARYRQYKDSQDRDSLFNPNDYNKGPNIDELASAYRDLRDNKNIIAKYQTAIDKLSNFENRERIPVIEEFLQTWRENAYNWYLNNAENYFNLKKNYRNALLAFAEDKGSSCFDSRGEISYSCEREFKRAYYEPIDQLTAQLTEFRFESRSIEGSYDKIYVPVSYEVDTEKLNKILDKEVIAKYNKLVNDVTAITGNITDATGLRISPKGEIDGIVVGDKGTASVNTFSAGGYNIQRFHYRTQIRKLY